MESRASAYIQKKIAKGYDKERIVGEMMFDFTLFYDEALRLYEEARKLLKEAKC